MAADQDKAIVYAEGGEGSAADLWLEALAGDSLLWQKREKIIALFEKNELYTKNGPVFQTAIIAGIMAAKRTYELIPMCHPLSLDHCSIKIRIEENDAIITCEVKMEGKTGVEMEALTGASVAALTIYDMCKSITHSMIISNTKLLSKKGGKSDVNLP